MRVHSVTDLPSQSAQVLPPLRPSCSLLPGALRRGHSLYFPTYPPRGGSTAAPPVPRALPPLPPVAPPAPPGDAAPPPPHQPPAGAPPGAAGRRRAPRPKRPAGRCRACRAPLASRRAAGAHRTSRASSAAGALRAGRAADIDVAGGPTDLRHFVARIRAAAANEGYEGKGDQEASNGGHTDP